MVVIRGQSRVAMVSKPNSLLKQALQGFKISVAFSGRFTRYFVRLNSVVIDKGASAAVLLEKQNHVPYIN